MATSVEWITAVITVPRADMTLLQLTPVEIRQLDTNKLRIDLRDLEDDVDGRPWPRTHDHNADVDVGGVTLADVLIILEPYTITFEDGQYAVTLLGTNNNILERNNKNQVSVNPSNSAGLITSAGIESIEYGRKVTVDIINASGNAVSGTLYPTGTLRQPSDNFPDTKLIATSRGFSEIELISDTTLTLNAELNFFTIRGLSHVSTQLIIQAAADVQGVTITDVELSGTLDGESDVTLCIIRDIFYFNGHIHDCSIGGRITLGGNSESYIVNCSRLEDDTTPTIDFDDADNDLVMPKYAGLVRIENMTDAAATAFIGLDQGVIVLDSATVTAGTVNASGVGSMTDELGNNIPSGTWNGVTILNMLISNESIADEVWATAEAEIVQKMLYNKVVKTGDIADIYEDNGIDIWKSFDLADGGRVEV